MQWERLDLKSSDIFGLILILFLCMFGTCGTSGSDETQHGKKLFTDSIQRPQFDEAEDPTVIRKRPITIDFNVLGKEISHCTSESVISKSLLLDLFEDTVYTAINDRIDPITPEFYSWVGHLKENKQSKVIVVIGDGLMPDGLLWGWGAMVPPARRDVHFWSLIGPLSLGKPFVSRILSSSSCLC